MKALVLAFCIFGATTCAYGAAGRWVDYDYDKIYYVIAERGSGITFKDSKTGEVLIKITGRSTFWYKDLAPAALMSRDLSYAVVCPRFDKAPCYVYSTKTKRLVWTAPDVYSFGSQSAYWTRVNFTERTVHRVIRTYEGKLIDDIISDCRANLCDEEE